MAAGDPPGLDMAPSGIGDPPPGKFADPILGVPRFIWSLGPGEGPDLLPDGDIPGANPCAPGIPV